MPRRSLMTSDEVGSGNGAGSHGIKKSLDLVSDRVSSVKAVPSDADATDEVVARIDRYDEGVGPFVAVGMPTYENRLDVGGRCAHPWIRLFDIAPWPQRQRRFCGAGRTWIERDHSSDRTVEH